MEIPSQLKFGNGSINYEDCNYYQQVLYREIVQLVTARDKLTTDLAKIKQTGVIEYLLAKLSAYGSLTHAKNFYEPDELTKGM